MTVSASPRPPGVAGARADRPRAAAYAAAVAALLHDYARDVVAAFALCPHLRDLERGLGAICVVVDPALDAEVAERAVRAAQDRGSTIVHAVYPLATAPAPAFERFANAVAARLARAGGARLVHAAFHPGLVADGDLASRMVALARRAPDPFVQLVPAEVATGGGDGARIEAAMAGDVAARVAARAAELAEARRRRDAAFADIAAT